MRVVSVALAAVALALLVSIPAAASCAPPVSTAENGARAVAVVYGTVTDAGGGIFGGPPTIRVDRVLKGQVGASVRFFFGPARGGTAATSVDYSVTAGADHVLYLIEGTDGQLETNSCTGSHPGPPNADEVAYFGAGTAPSGGGAQLTVPGTSVPIAQALPIALLVVVILGGASTLILRRRSS